MRWLSLVALATALTMSSAAGAGPAEEAKSIEAEARKAFQAKRYADAARAFARAHALDPRAATKYNEAQAWSKAGSLAAAADAFESALELGLDGKLGAKANKRIAELKAELGYLVVPGPPGGQVTVAHVVDREVPAKVHLPVGKHEVTLRNADGKAASIEVASAAGVSNILEVPESLTTVEPEPGPQTPEPVVPQPLPEEEEDGTVMIALGWTAVGLAAAATGATVATGVLTLQKVDEYDEGGNVDADLRDQASTFRTTTNVMIGVSAGLAATGLLLLLLAPSGPDDEPAEAAAVTLDTSGGALSLRW